MKKLIFLMLIPLFLCSCGDSATGDTAEEEIIPLHSNLVAKYGDMEEDLHRYLQDGITEQNVTVSDEDVSITLAQTYHDKHNLAMAVDVTFSEELFNTITEDYDPSLPLDETAYLPIAFTSYDEPIENTSGLSATDYIKKYQSYRIPWKQEEISLVAIDTASYTLSYVIYVASSTELCNRDIHMVLSGFVDSSVDHSPISDLYGDTQGEIQYNKLLPLDFSLGEGALLPEYDIDDLAEGTCYFSPLSYYISYNQYVDDFYYLYIYTILDDGTEADLPKYRYTMKNNGTGYSSIGYAGWMDTRNIAEVMFDREKTIAIINMWDEEREAYVE